MTVIQGLNTAGTVRVGNLANLENILNLVANGTEVIGIVWGLYCIFQAIKSPARRKTRIALGLFLLTAGLSAPTMVNYLIAGGRDCVDLF